MMKDDVLKTLIGEEELKKRVQELGEQITRDYQGKNLLLVSVLKGSIAFMADLMRAIDLPLSMEMLEAREPSSVKICTLLDKPERRQVAVAPAYVGFTVPDEFVIGYGLDYDEKYRNLPYIGVLKPEVYTK